MQGISLCASHPAPVPAGRMRCHDGGGSSGQAQWIAVNRGRRIAALTPRLLAIEHALLWRKHAGKSRKPALRGEIEYSGLCDARARLFIFRGD